MATQDDYIRTALRVPPELHAQIHASAKANNRTFNAEIVARLQESFEPRANIFINDISGQTTIASSASPLTQLAGELNALQDRRNTLAVLLHAATSREDSAKESVESQKIRAEIAVIDEDIAKTLTAMQYFTRSPT